MDVFLHSLPFALSIVSLGTDALCWEQELHGAWSASSGGLLSVYKLFCFGQIPPHCGVRQSGPCFKETSFVSTECGIKRASLMCSHNSLCCCWSLCWFRVKRSPSVITVIYICFVHFTLAVLWQLKVLFFTRTSECTIHVRAASIDRKWITNYFGNRLIISVIL